MRVWSDPLRKIRHYQTNSVARRARGADRNNIGQSARRIAWASRKYSVGSGKLAFGISLTAISPPCCGIEGAEYSRILSLAYTDFFKLLVIEFRRDTSSVDEVVAVLHLHLPSIEAAAAMAS